MLTKLCHRLFLFLVLAVGLAGMSHAALPETVEKIKPSILAIGTFERTRSPQFRLNGTGFVVGDGNLAVTNAHVVRTPMDVETGEKLIVLARTPAGTLEPREAFKVAFDAEHDLALLKISGARLPAMVLAPDDSKREGEQVAFTGFPIVGVLGPYPATHRGIIAALAPVAIPGANANQLSPKLIRRLAKGPFTILQLDATAYPGDSGSPLYDPNTGEVVGIINMVLVKSTKESAITDPSGITYAIPVRYLRELMSEQR
ncbi:MAG: serine protease [Rhodocyclaceae bacterium]|nr:serine protease [Rhodocyclaceae bacterium]